MRFRTPFAESVLDRVEVPPATYGTGVKPQFGLLIQLLNFLRAQTADALFLLHIQVGTDMDFWLDAACVTIKDYLLVIGYTFPFGGLSRTVMRQWIDRTNSLRAYVAAINVSSWDSTKEIKHNVKTGCRVLLGDGIGSAFRRAKKQRKTTLLRLAIRKNAESAF